MRNEADISPGYSRSLSGQESNLGGAPRRLHQYSAYLAVSRLAYCHADCQSADCHATLPVCSLESQELLLAKQKIGHRPAHAGAFLFEDLGVTAFAGAIPVLTGGDAQEAAAGILGVEAYHGGLLRQWLFENGDLVVQPYGIQVVSFVQVRAHACISAAATLPALYQRCTATYSFVCAVVPTARQATSDGQL